MPKRRCGKSPIGSIPLNLHRSADFRRIVIKNMKLELWYADMIRFMRNASEYGTYYQELAKKLAPWLEPDMRICDAGSGLGYLSLALAPYAGQVTAVEKHPDASAVLTENCLRFGVSNVKAVCASVDQVLPEEPYDAMVFCFFGQIGEILNISKKQCRGDILIFTRNYSQHRFSAGNYETGMEGCRHVSEYLSELGIPFSEETLVLEFGQPFRDLKDARLFFERYSKDPDKSVLTEDFLRSKVTETGREDFPLYMPHDKKLAFIRFSALDIPDSIG